MIYVKPKKHLGQHFLNDKSIASDIVNALDENTTDLLEIGPGTGVLTDFIIEKNIPGFKIIEIDRESVVFLNERYPNLKEQLISGDFLKMTWERSFPINLVS